MRNKRLWQQLSTTAINTILTVDSLMHSIGCHTLAVHGIEAGHKFLFYNDFSIAKLCTWMSGWSVLSINLKRRVVILKPMNLSVTHV